MSSDQIYLPVLLSVLPAVGYGEKMIMKTGNRRPARATRNVEMNTDRYFSTNCRIIWFILFLIEFGGRRIVTVVKCYTAIERWRQNWT